jgi:hypothetical protein
VCDVELRHRSFGTGHSERRLFERVNLGAGDLLALSAVAGTARTWIDAHVQFGGISALITNGSEHGSMQEL